jgi:hypothetical protein
MSWGTQADQQGKEGPVIPKNCKRLASAFSALYPKGSEEKRLIDAMLLAVPR